MTHHGFSQSTVSTVSINAVITLQFVNAQTPDATSSSHRQTPYAAAASAGTLASDLSAAVKSCSTEAITKRSQPGGLFMVGWFL